MTTGAELPEHWLKLLQMALQIEIRSATERRRPPKMRLPQMNADENPGPAARHSRLHRRYPLSMINDLCLQTGNPWGHSHHSQCYRRRADRQGYAVEVTRIFCVSPEASRSCPD